MIDHPLFAQQIFFLGVKEVMKVIVDARYFIEAF